MDTSTTSSKETAAKDISNLISENIFHYQKVDVHVAIDESNKATLVYAIKDHDLIITMLKNNEIVYNSTSFETISASYCQLELPAVSPESLKKALSDLESRTRIEEKEVNGKKVFCRLTRVYKDMECGGDIKSVGRVLTEQEVVLLQSLLFITTHKQADSASV